MKHIKIEVVANEYQQEELIALLDDYNPTGFEQADDKLIGYFNEEDFAKEAVLNVLQGYQYQFSSLEEQNWNAIWESNFQPVVVGNFCAVRAHFHEPIANVEHEILITPKMSFGTGHHATTFMMMEQMQAIDFLNKTVFDFGTGTGILSILAEKLGAAKITAIDIDDWSIENAKESIQRNSCSKIDVTLSSNIPQQKFGIVLANINRNVILQYMPRLAEVISTGGLILFSGLLVKDEEDIQQAATKNNLKFVKRKERQGWLSLLFADGIG